MSSLLFLVRVSVDQKPFTKPNLVVSSLIVEFATLLFLLRSMTVRRVIKSSVHGTTVHSTTPLSREPCSYTPAPLLLVDSVSPVLRGHCSTLLLGHRCRCVYLHVLVPPCLDDPQVCRPTPHSLYFCVACLYPSSPSRPLVSYQ